MDKPSPVNVPWILGLDLGTNSIGWAALKVDDHHNPIEILNAGVRIFPAGTDGTDKDFRLERMRRGP